MYWPHLSFANIRRGDHQLLHVRYNKDWPLFRAMAIVVVHTPFWNVGHEVSLGR